MIFMLHHTEYGMYLGSVYVEDNTANNSHEHGPLGLIQQWWDEFQATHPDADTEFVNFLTLQGNYAEQEGGPYYQMRAREAAYYEEAPELPMQIYLPPTCEE